MGASIMTFKPLTRDSQCFKCGYPYGAYHEDAVRSAFDWLKEQMLIRYYQFDEMPDSIIKESHMREIDSIYELVDEAFPVFSQSLSEDAKINDGCSQQVTSAPSSEAKSSVSHHVSMGAATVSVAPMIIQSFCLKCNRHCKGVWYYCPNCSKPIHSQSLSQPSGVEAPSIASEVSQQRKRVDGEKTLDFFEEKHGVPAGELSDAEKSCYVRGLSDVKHAPCKGNQECCTLEEYQEYGCGCRCHENSTRKGCICKHGSGAITKRFVEENKLCNCECHKVKE